MDRAQDGKKVAVDYGTTRSTSFTPHEDLKLDIFVDHSLVEIFVNGGEHVLTGRFFTDPVNQRIKFDQDTNYQGTFYNMEMIL